MGSSEDDRSPSPAAGATGSNGSHGGKSDDGTGKKSNNNTIDLKLLSPSVDVPASGLFFEDIRTTTTLGELRTRITAALPSHPPAARQRLIYFGRVLQRDDDTLAGVFGENNIQQHRQHTLHLVLPPRESGSQTPNAPSPIPGPRASIYPPTSIPRPSSVPPRGTGAASPFRPANWPPQPQPQLATPQTSAPTSAAATPLRPPRPPLQQPQPRAQTPDPTPGEQRYDIRSVLGNANIRANITANGQPINLPPEVINQLLNQHFLRNGGLPDLLAGATARPEGSGTPPVPTPPPQANTTGQGNTAGQGTSTGQQLFQQFMASVNDANRQATPGAGGDGSAPSSQNTSPTEGDETRGRSQEQGSSTQGAPDPPAEAPRTASGGNGQAPDPSASAHQQPPPQPQPGAQPINGQPRVHERSGVNPDGTRWSIRTVENTHTHTHPHPHPHPHHHHHNAAHTPQQPPQFPPNMAGFPMPFPPGFPFPQLQPGAAQTGLPIPLGNLRPQHIGTPRSASPARSVSEGPRRIGTPAAELQNRLMNTNAEIQNLGQLLGVLANGTTASGAPAPPLTQEQMNQIRQYGESMNGHLDGFGHDLIALANMYPGIRTQPEFAGLSAMFQAVQGQGRIVTARIEDLAGQVAPQNASTPAAQDAVVPPTDSNTPPSLATPSTTSDTLSPSLITRETSPADALPTTTAAAPTTTVQPPSVPQIHLLTDPTQTQHYLLIGPNSLASTAALPLDVLYPLLAAQVPHDQLVRDFNRATAEMTRALHRADLRGVLQAGFAGTAGTDPGRHASTASTATVTSNAPAPTGVRQPGQAPPNPAAGPANAPAAPPAAQAAPQAQAQRAGPPDEMRDVLAPIVRNLWLIVRLCIFAYFFFSSGRGYGRLLLLSVLGAFVWAVNAGLLGARLNGVLEAVRRHFGEVVEEARHGVAGQGQAQAQQGGAGAGAGEGAVGTPEEAARRLMVRRAEGQRRRVWDAVRRVERSVALAVASLWPGVGEAVVRNHERIIREREEAERRLREEEEEARREQLRVEAEEKSKNGEGTVGAVEAAGESSASGVQVGGGEGVERVNKGKEKATAEESGGGVD